METERRTSRKGSREIISVALPVALYDALQNVCESRDLNRSAMIASAISAYLERLGVKVGER